MKFYGDNIFLVGAGLSVNYPSSIPFAFNITQEIIKWLAQGSQELEQKILSLCSASPDKNPFDFIRFEGLIQTISLIVPDFTKSLSTIEVHGIPNIFHLSLMKRLAQGDNILTTNFDTRFEKAALWLDLNITQTILSNDSQFEKDHINHDFIKLHGTFGSKDNLPCAKLNQIGLSGLAFDNFPNFRNWFSKITKGKNFYILGYSGLDSFDVVPLIEQYCNAKNVIWFDYKKSQDKINYKKIKPKENLLVPYCNSDLNLIDISLVNMANRNLHTYKVTGNDLSLLFSDQFDEIFASTANRFNELSLNEGFETADKDNLTLFRETLHEETLSYDEQKLIIDRLLSSDNFGEHMIKPLDEDDEVEKGEMHTQVSDLIKEGKRANAVALLEQYAKSDEFIQNEDYWVAKALVELEDNNPKMGFQIINHWYELAFPEKDETTYELELMFVESEFEHYYDIEDVEGMNKACFKLKELAQRYGIIWGFIQWHHKMDRFYSFQLLKTSKTKDIINYRNKALRHAELAAYYSLRTGRKYWYMKFVRRYVMHLSHFGQFDLAALELTQLLSWINNEDHQERGMTLYSIASNYIEDGQFKNAREILDSIKSLSEQSWKIKRIVLELIKIDLNISTKKVDQEDIIKQLTTVREMLDNIDPDDQWYCVEQIEFLIDKSQNKVDPIVKTNFGSI